MSELFGIDFGTTNSAVVGLSNDKSRSYGDGEGQPYPSLIAIDKMTAKVVSRGRDTWKRREELRRECEIIVSPKTLLGSGKTWLIGGKEWTPENVVTEIFKGLQEKIQQRTRDDSAMNKAVVAIPIGFEPIKRKSLRKAAHAAGIEICGLISEPTAAVYRHYETLRKWQKVAVFDWGGGTLDISVVELVSGNVREIATFGLRLGGDDIDEKIAKWTHNQILRKKGGDISFDEMTGKARDELIVKAEEAKRALSDSDDAPINLYDYGEFGGINVSIHREIFLSLFEPEMDNAIMATRDAVKNARISLEEIGAILMVGGSSKLCGLYDRIQEAFPSCQVIPPDAESDWHTAHGAALLNQNRGQYVLSQNVGLRLSDDTYFPLVREGEEIDNQVQTVNFVLVEDSNSARFIFEENTDNMPDSFGNGRKTLDYMTVPTYGFTKEPIELKYQIDENLLFKAEARSTNMNESARWEYEKLRFSYQLPGEDNE